MAEWRYILQRLPSGEFVDFDIPLVKVEVTRTLSGPGSLSGTVPVPFGNLVGLGGLEWGAAIWAEADGEIRGGGIIESATIVGDEWKIECVGFSGLIGDQPWMGPDLRLFGVDPTDEFRRIWSYASSTYGLPVSVGSDKSGFRIGVEGWWDLSDVDWAEIEGRASWNADNPNPYLVLKKNGKYPVTLPLSAFKRGTSNNQPPTGGREVPDEPFSLAWWETTDLGDVVTKLATDRFDYRESSSWSGESIVHRLELGVPVLGSRREGLRFVEGENLAARPDVVRDAAGYASGVVVLGSGEGSARVFAKAERPTSRLKRFEVVVDRSVDRSADASSVARNELEWLSGGFDVSTVTVFDHPNAPIGSVDVGDVIFILGDSPWVELGLWVRVTEVTFRPDREGEASFRVRRES